MIDEIIEGINSIGWFIRIAIAWQIIDNDPIAGVGKLLNIGLKITPAAGTGTAAVNKNNGLGCGIAAGYFDKVSAQPTG